MSASLVFEQQVTSRDLVEVRIIPCSKVGSTLTQVTADAVVIAGPAIGALVSADFGTEVEHRRGEGSESRLMDNDIIKEGKVFNITCNKRASGASGALIDPISHLQQNYDNFFIRVIDRIVIGTTVNNRTRSGYFIRGATGDTYGNEDNTWTASFLPRNVGASTYTETVAPA